MSHSLALTLAEQAVQEFFRRWCAGLQPCLLLETHTNGEIYVNSRVTTGVTLPQQTEQADWLPPHGHRHPRHQGPARLRRRARRAHAQATAAVNAAAAKNIVTAVQADQTLTLTADAAVQAVVQAPHSVDAAVQAGRALQQDQAALQPDHAAAQAGRALPGHQPCHDAPAGQAGRQLQHPPIHQHHHPHQVVKDVLCQDIEYYKLVRKEKEVARNDERQEDLDNFTRMIQKTCKF